MLVLMYNVPQMETERERKRGKWGGEFAHLTSVNICIRKLPHMLPNRLCQHVLRPTVRMRNFSYASPGLCFCFGFRHAVLWFLYVYTFVAVAPKRWLLSGLFSFFSEFPLLFLLLLSSLDCSFDYISINWWQFYVCTFQHLSAFEMFIFYDALGRFSVFLFLGVSWKFVSILSCFLCLDWDSFLQISLAFLSFLDFFYVLCVKLVYIKLQFYCIVELLANCQKYILNLIHSLQKRSTKAKAEQREKYREMLRRGNCFKFPYKPRKNGKQ